MIFVDTNVFMYAVGGPHPLRDSARTFFDEHQVPSTRLVTSAEVIQELLHAYLKVNRLKTLDTALRLVETGLATVWPVEVADVRGARALIPHHPGLSARDLVHLACCHRHGAHDLMTYDRALAAAFAAA
ncbi:MAG: type II toxin-antitoxin system VapC family toxin [Gemmatimonadales bacterium]